jgi:hypothetical protein
MKPFDLETSRSNGSPDLTSRELAHLQKLLPIQRLIQLKEKAILRIADRVSRSTDQKEFEKLGQISRELGHQIVQMNTFLRSLECQLPSPVPADAAPVTHSKTKTVARVEPVSARAEISRIEWIFGLVMSGLVFSSVGALVITSRKFEAVKMELRSRLAQGAVSAPRSIVVPPAQVPAELRPTVR